MSEQPLRELITKWRNNANTLDRGETSLNIEREEALRECADELENALREWMEAYKAGHGDRNLQCWYMEKMLGMVAERQQASSEKDSIDK